MAEYEDDALPESEDEDEGEYWSTEDEVKEEVAERRAKANKIQTEWREEAGQMYEFVAGNQWDEATRAKAQADKRPLVTFNRVGPIVNAVCGQQICNRQETRFLPREQGDMQKAELWGSVVAWAREQCDAEDEESDAFRDLVITGMGWTGTTVEYDEDPAGMIKEQRIDPRRMRWDPASRKKNLADARWVQCDYWFDDDEIEERWPDKEVDISPNGKWEQNPNIEMHDATNAWRYEKNFTNLDEIDGKFRVIHEVHWCLEDTYQFADINGEVSTLSEDEWDKLKSRLSEMGMEAPNAAKTKSRRYYEAWICGNTVLEFGPYPLKTGFEYKCMTGLRDEEGRWYGLVKPLVDPQMFANKTFTQIVGILNSNAKGGIVVEDSAVENHSKFESEWSKSDGVAWVNDGAVSNGRIQPKPPPQIPAELTKLLEYSVGGMREVTGVNVEFLGQTDKVQTGIVEAMRTKAGLVILAPWFDAMRLYMKQQGRLLAEYINTYIADGRWIRISGTSNLPQPAPMPGMQPGMPMQPGMIPPQGGMMHQQPPAMDGMRYIQLMKEPGVLKYDIVVDESTQSRDARERYFQALMQVIPMALQSGVPVPAEVIDYAPLPETLRIKWKAEIDKMKSAPQQPPIALQIEQMRSETQKQIEAMRADSKAQQTQMDNQLKAQQIAMQAEADRVTQAAQAESQRMVDQSKLHMESVLGMMDQKREQEKMVLEAKLNTFETILNAIVDLQKSRLEAAQTPPDVSSQVIPKVTEMLDAHNQQMAHVMAVLTAPEEIIRDQSGRAVGKRKIVKGQPKSGSELGRYIQAMSAPEEIVRDSTGKAVGKRKIAAAGKGDGMDGDLQWQLTELLKVMSAPTEVVRDSNGRAVGTRKVLQ